MVEEQRYIVSGGVNGQNSPLLPIPKAEERQVKSNSYRWKCLGIQGKTLWDLMDLLLVPGLLLVVTFMFNDQAQRREETFNIERKKQEVVQNYLSKMTDLILSGKLIDQQEPINEQTNKAPIIAAKALTQSALRDLKGDGNRKGQVLSFLYDAQLITYPPPVPDKKPKSIIDMDGVELDEMESYRSFGKADPQKDGSQLAQSPINLGGANLTRSYLIGSDLNHAYLEGARLLYANLERTDLKNAVLKRANLKGANLAGANLAEADLSYADLTEANLTGANLSGSRNINNVKLNGAILKGAHLRGAQLVDANLNNADFTEADLTNANIKNADIVGAKFCETTMPQGTVNYSSCPKPAK